MIKALNVKNYALIEELNLSPSASLNIITGETGAGKSILLGALGLLLGKRADVKSLFNADKKCAVEGHFYIDKYNLQPLFEKFDLDYEEETLIRREINPNGKSRAFINDTPVTLDVLKEIGMRLMDIHSQHESLELGKNKYQLDTLDLFSNHAELVNTLRSCYDSYDRLQSKLNHFMDQSAASEKELDYQKFIFKELEDANLVAGEQEDLEKEVLALENSEEIKEKLGSAETLLDGHDNSIINAFAELNSQLSRIRDFGENYNGLSQRVESILIELKDVLQDLSNENSQVLHDPERLATVKERIDLIYRLQQKHHVSDLKSLLVLKDELDEGLQSYNDRGAEINRLSKELEVAEKKMLNSANALSISRKKHAPEFASSIEKIIRLVGIENGKVEIAISSKKAALDGIDQVEYLFSANKGIAARPLKDVASGGEFSRLIFAIKYLLADKTSLPTVIFDEIDTGVSGEVAIQMVKLLKKMASKHQIISISHLPQFAAAADDHYFVFKDHRAEKSVSKIRKLHDEERVNNIATMIGGTNASESAIQSAKELVNELSVAK